MTSSELVHYGIKGMKWGVRRANLDAPNNRYSSANRTKDRSTHGERGVKRINRRLNKGQSLVEARARETTRTNALITGALATAAALKIAGPVLLQSIAVRAERNRARAEYDRSQSENQNIGTSGRYGVNGKPFEPNKEGVYDIYSEGGVKDFQRRR